MYPGALYGWLRDLLWDVDRRNMFNDQSDSIKNINFLKEFKRKCIDASSTDQVSLRIL
jgi:hypothetical protein